jgi:hypothetical protein
MDTFKTLKITQPGSGGPLQELLVGAVQTSGGAADAGKVVLLNASGQIDPSMGGGGGGSSFPVSTPQLVVSGGSIVASGTGAIDATELATTGTPVNVSLSAPPAHAGQLLISQPGNTTAVWADPLVQGLFPPNTNVATGNSGGPVNPVLVGAQNPSNLLENLNVDASGNLKVAQQGATTVSGTVAFSNTTIGVTNSGTFAVQDAAAESYLQGILDALFSGVAVEGIYAATAPVLTDGSSNTLLLNSSGALVVTGTISNFPAFTFTNYGSPAAKSLNVYVVNQSSGGGGGGSVTQGTTPWVVSLASTTITGTVAVTQSTSPWVVSNTGTFAVQDSTLASYLSTLAGTVVTSGSPAAPSLRVTSDYLAVTTALPAAVSGGAQVVPAADKFGRTLAVLNSPRELVGTASLGPSSSSSAVSFITAGGAGVFNDIITFIATNFSATATIVTVSDNGAGGNTYSFALAPNGGIVVNFPTPLPQGTSAAAWDVLNSAGNVCYYTAVYARNK